MKGNNRYKKEIRKCWIENHIGMIPLANGQVAMVDEDRLLEVSKYNWSIHGGGYAQTSYKYKLILMHRLLFPELHQIDHIDGNRLDNRKQNIRECNESQNQANRGKTRLNTSGFKGVSWSNKSGKWCVKIGFRGNKIHLGLFSCLKQAALTYNNKAIELHGAFARLNEVK